jgi:hypothetical protein
MRKKIALLLLLLTGITWALSAETQYLSGDDKIDDIQKRIDEEKKKQKEKDNQKETKDKDDDSSANCWGNLIGACIGGFCNAMLSSGSDVTDSTSDDTESTTSSGGCNPFSLFNDFNYAPYPYAKGWNNDIASWSKSEPDDRKLGYASISASGSYLLDNLGSGTVQLDAGLLLLHFNGFYQYTFAETKSMNIYSVNGGLSLPLQFALVNAFCGVFYYDYIGTALFSFGVSAKFLLPANLVLDVYNLNSFYYSLGFHIINASLSFAVDRFTIGAGYRFYSYAGLVLHGPELKVSVWL